MKKILALLVVLLLTPPAWAGDWDGGGRELKLPKEGFVVLTGETIYFRLPGAAHGSCRAVGDVLRSLGPVKDGAGVRCGFVAEKPGTVVVALLGTYNESVAVKVIAPEQAPVVTVTELCYDPMRYREGLYALRGENRRWSAPAGVEVKGSMVTRSDWIVQDSTGAVYVTGSAPPSWSPVLAVGWVEKEGSGWAFHTLRVVEPMAAAVELKGDRVNELKVGRVGAIKVFPNKSEVVTFSVNGESVVLESFTRDEIKVKAVKPGDSEVKVYVRWFTDGYHIDGPEPPGSTAPPTMTVKIKVVP